MYYMIEKAMDKIYLSTWSNGYVAEYPNGSYKTYGYYLIEIEKKILIW